MTRLEVGRILRASTIGFIAGCRVSQLDAPSFGALVHVPLGNALQVYGLIYDIHIDDDGLIRQLVTAGNVSQEVMQDNRERRIVPIELSVLTVGHEHNGKIYHLLPPRPPLSLDAVYLSDEKDIARFTGAGRFGYFRHMLRSQDVPVAELLSAHIQQAQSSHKDPRVWKDGAISEIITLLRDDYPTLMSVLGSINEVVG